MRRFVAGIVVGVLLAAGAWLLWKPERPGPRTEPAGTSAAGPAASSSDVPREMLEASPRAPKLRGTDKSSEPFAPGTAVLRIGEDYVFGEEHARQDGGAADVACLDIRTLTTLAFPNGAARAVLPLLTREDVPTGAECFGYAVDAPATFEPATFELSPTKPVHDRYFGLVFARSATGTVYKVAVIATSQDAQALRRTVTLRYASVPSTEGGGKLRIPDTVQGNVVGADEIERITGLLTAPGSIPVRGGTVQSHVMAVSPPTSDLEFKRPAQLIVEGTLRTNIKGPGLGVFVRGDVAAGAVVEASSGIILVEGDLDGTVVVPGMGRLRVMGNLNGRVKLQGQSTVVVDVDVAGTFEVNGINHIYVKGRFLHPASNFAMNGINHTYMGSYATRADIARFQNVDGIQTLHLRDSDVERKEDALRVPPWDNVYVGAPLWEQMR